MFQNGQSDRFERLRNKAEELLKLHPQEGPPFQSEDFSELIHELEVHQVELELQNWELQTSQQELTALQQEYERLYEFAPCGYLILDVRGIITRTNLSALSLLHADRGILGVTTFSTFIAPGWRNAFQFALQEAVQTGLKQSIELPLKGESGSPRWVKVNIQAERDGAGAVQQWRMVLDDITLRKQTEEALQKSQETFSTIFHRSPSFMLITDLEDGTIIEVNEAYCRLSGYAREELLGRSAVELGIFAPEDRLREVELLKEKGSFRNREERRRTKSGQIRYVLLSAETMELEGRQCILSMGLDITERKRNEQALQETKELADAANKAKTEFLANMSHEIRTPLNGVKGMIELASRASMEPEVKGYLELAGESADHLLCIINDIIDLSKIEAGNVELHKQPFSLRDCLEVTLFPLQSAAASKGLAFTVDVEADIPECLFGDQNRLRQIVENVVGNAVKFTQEGSVSVSLSLHEDRGDRVRLLCTVRDSGIGISKEDQKRIFEDFGQANSSFQAKFGGAGLGLAICRRYLKLMDGEIWCSSSEGQGSTFSFSTVFQPCQEQEQSEPLAGLDVGASSQPLKVLLAEDSRMNQIFAQELLRDLGHELVIAKDGREALQALADDNFDLVLMDIRMPNLDGEEALRIIRQEPPSGVDPHVPVVALTAYAMKGDEDRLLSLGFDAYLAKPVDIQAFERIIADIGKRKGSDRPSSAGD